MTKPMRSHRDLDDLMETYRKWQTWTNEHWAEAYEVVPEDGWDVAENQEQNLRDDATRYFGCDEAEAWKRLDEEWLNRQEQQHEAEYMAKRRIAIIQLKRHYTYARKRDLCIKWVKGLGYNEQHQMVAQWDAERMR